MALMTGKNIFITGGSRGIGFATAREALLEGANAVARKEKTPAFLMPEFFSKRSNQAVVQPST